MRKIHIDEEGWAARKLRLSTMQIVALGFMGIILAGGLLLWLPFSNRQPISFLDALFTAVTCVCVTGLVTVVPATQFTLIGKGIMLVLIQIGGLGVIACTSAFFLLLRKKISFRGRQMISQSYGLDTMSGMVKFIIRVLKGTFTVEAIGAVFYSIRFVQDYGVVKGVGYGIFHSVSAFCNAGVDLLGSNSLIGYAGSPLINFTTILLIVVSGLGFPVWYDILGNIKKSSPGTGNKTVKMAVYKAGTAEQSGAGHDRVSDLIWNGIILFTGIFQPGNHGRIFSYEEADGISVPVGDDKNRGICSGLSVCTAAGFKAPWMSVNVYWRISDRNGRRYQDDYGSHAGSHSDLGTAGQKGYGMF